MFLKNNHIFLQKPKMIVLLFNYCVLSMFSDTVLLINNVNQWRNKMAGRLFCICKFFFSLAIAAILIVDLHAVTESAVRTSVTIKNELAVLLTKNTALMTPEEYAAWKKKIDDGLTYLKAVFPEVAQNYEQAVELKSETYRVSHNLAQEPSSNKKAALTEANVSTTTIVKDAPQVSKELVVFNQALEKIKSFPQQIKNDLAKLKLTVDELPLFYSKLQEVDAVEDLFVELLAAGLITAEIKKDFYAQKDAIVQSISNGIAQVAKAVLSFALKDVSGLKAQVAFAEKLAKLDMILKITSAPWADLEHYIALFLGINDLLMAGFWQENDVLITVLSTVDKQIIDGIKTDLNAIVNYSLKDNLPIGLYDRIVHYIKIFLEQLDRIVEGASLEHSQYDFIDKKCDELTDYLACMVEFESILLKHYNQKGIELSAIDSYGADELVALLNTIKKKIEQHTNASVASRKTELDSLLITFDAASLAMHKVVNAFKNPVQDTIPNIGALYNEVQKTYNNYLTLVESKKIGGNEQDIFLKEYNDTLKDLDTQTVQFINKILEYIITKENLPAINTWLKATVSSYAKGIKKMNTLVTDGETKFKLYADLVKVLTDLFIKGVGLQGQAITFNIIAKRGLVDPKVMDQCESYINILFNTAKDANGSVKGLVSRAIEAVDSLLLLAQEYMSSLDLMLVKAYQNQIALLVSLLERLFDMENVLVEPEVQKFVKKNIPNPFSSSDILIEAQALVNPAYAEQFALKLSGSNTIVSQQNTPSLAQDIFQLLDSIDNDVLNKLATLKTPDTIPSFAKEYSSLIEAEELYQDMKKDFNSKEKDDYKNRSLKVAQSIDVAVIQVAFKVIEYVIQKGGLFEKQLAYIDNLYVNFAKGQTNVLSIGETQEFKTIMTQAQKIKQLFDVGLSPLKNISPVVLQLDIIKKNGTQLISFLNSMCDSSLDVKTKNAPVGLLNKLVATWLKFFEDWQKSVQKSTVVQIQQMQLQLKPSLDLLVYYKDMAIVLQTIATTIPILHPDMSLTFVETVQKILDTAQAQSFIVASVDTSTMQAKQAVQSNKQLESTPTTIDQSVVFEKSKEVSEPLSSKKTKQSSSNKEAVKKDLPAQAALEHFAKVKDDFVQSVTKIDLSKLVIPSVQDLFAAIEKVQASFEFDSALTAVTSDENTQVEKAHQELLLFAFQQAFSIGKTVLEKSNAELKDIIKEFKKLLKTYAQDQKKVADIKKDVALKTIINRIQNLNSMWTLSLYQLTELKNSSVNGTISTLDGFIQQLNLLIDNTVKDNTYVGFLNNFIDQWRSFFNALLGYMKTLPVDKVILYQQELLFLQDICNVIDKSVAKINAIIDGKRIVVKKGNVSAGFGDILQKITKKENAAQYSKESINQAATDVQKALISLSEAITKQK